MRLAYWLTAVAAAAATLAAQPRAEVRPRCRGARPHRAPAGRSLHARQRGLARGDHDPRRPRLLRRVPGTEREGRARPARDHPRRRRQPRPVATQRRQDRRPLRQHDGRGADRARGTRPRRGRNWRASRRSQTPAQLAEEAGRLAASGDGGLFDGIIGGDPQSPGSLAVQLTQGGTLLPDRDHYLRSGCALCRDPRRVRSVPLADLLARRPRGPGGRRARAPGARDRAGDGAVERRRDARRQPKRRTLPARAAACRDARLRLGGVGAAAGTRSRGDHRARAAVFLPGVCRDRRAYADAHAEGVADGALSDRHRAVHQPRVRRRALRVLRPRADRAAGADRALAPRRGARERLPRRRDRPPVCGAALPIRHRSSKVARLVETIVDAYREAIATSSWLSQPAKAEARRKLDRLTIRIGYPGRVAELSKPRHRAGRPRRQRRARTAVRRRDCDSAGSASASIRGCG